VLNATYPAASTVYYANGKEVGCFCSVNRTTITEAQVQLAGMKPVLDAVTAAEDRNFFHEGGVSLTGILRAAKNDVMGNSLQGGSTITEELVKSYYDSSYIGNLTLHQKVGEVFVSIKLAQERSKLWVMTHYLNAIYFGNGAWGIEAAAETYFGRNAWQLSVPQAAMLGAMIQSPSGYEPTHPDYAPPGLSSLAWRWRNETLANEVKNADITQAQANAMQFPKVHISPPASNWTGYSGYIMNTVENELEANYGLSSNKIWSGGFQIHTTIWPGLMNALYSAIRQNKQLMAEDAAQGNGSPLPSYVHIAAVLEQPGTGNIRAFYGGPGMGIKHCKRYGCDENTILEPSWVGSSFKPYVLATAVSEGMNSQTSILNSHSPLCIPPADDTPALRLQRSKQTMSCDTNIGYYQFNESSENTPGHNDTVPEATAASNNAAYEDLIHRTGVDKVINVAATNLGVSPGTINDIKQLFWACGGCKQSGQYPGSVQTALGEADMTAVDQANTFSVLMSDETTTPHMIDYVIQNGQKLPSPLHPHQAFSDPYVAADTDYALSFDTDGSMGGTGYPNAVWDRPMVAKTGTIGDGTSSSAAWFIGAIPQYALSVGMFTTKSSTEFLDSLPARPGGWTGGYGGAWPATIWHTFMSEKFSNLPIKQLPATNFSPPVFTKWVQALPIKKKCTQTPPKKHGFGFFGNGPGGNGPGGNGKNGNGNNCQKGGNPNPSPSPSPSGSPSPSPSPSGSPSPGGSPSPSFPPFAKSTSATKSSKPGRHSAASIPILTTAAVLNLSVGEKPGWAPSVTGLA
jgi:membrane peptidoglycan carboxypeptidase